MQFDILPHPFFAIRLPSRPISQLVALLNEYGTEGNSNQGALLDILLDQPGALEALYVASPGLFAEWCAIRDQSQAMKPAVERALWRYVFRAFSRATPFGLFAGVGFGLLAEQTGVEFGKQAWRTVSRPDSAVLIRLCQALEENPQVRQQLGYRLNDSLYTVLDQYRFSERVEANDGHQSIDLTSLEVTPELGRIVAAFERTPVLVHSDLVDLFPENSPSEVTRFLSELIDMQFLQSELNLPVTGNDMFGHLLRIVNTLSGTIVEKRQVQLATIRTILDQDNLLLSDRQKVQELLYALSDSQPTAPPEPTTLVQTDLFFQPVSLTLERKVANQIGQQAGRLRPLMVRVSAPLLSGFMDRFTARFDQQQVSLLTALDPEVGVGYDLSPPFKPFSTEVPFAIEAPPQVNNPDLDTLRITLYSRHLLSGQHEIEVSDADLQSLTLPQPGHTFPPTWVLLGELYQSQHTTGRNPEWRFYVKPTLGTTAAALLGRFCHGIAPLREAVRHMNAWEQSQYPDDVLAEIVHLPATQARAGNVVSRPVLRPFEIPYLTPPGVSAPQTIPLAELLVSVRTNTIEREIIITHKLTGRRIRPRLSSAHNVERGDEVYQFLNDVQRMDYLNHHWSWGKLALYPFLPRIRYQNVIISRARWCVQRHLLPADIPLTIDGLRALYKLPRYVLLVEGDNELLLDLRLAACGQILLQEINKNDAVRLHEWLGETHQHWIRGEEQTYASEVVLPFQTKAVKQTLPDRRSQIVADIPLIQRNFLPGDEWLYLKIYGAEQTADQLLTDLLMPMARQAAGAGWSQAVFFVRYADPDPHLRIRFHCPTNGFQPLLSAWQQALKPLLQAGLVERVQVDTYQRELERYRPALIESCEKIFCADSHFVLGGLATLLPGLGDEDRYALALLSVDELLNDFGFPLEEKTAMSRRLQESFWREHGSSKDVRQHLNILYRRWGATVYGSRGPYQPLVADRHQVTKEYVAQIRNYFSQSQDSVGLMEVVQSLMHMAINRIFPGQFRRHELVVYHFMARRYESQLALQNKTGSIDKSP